MVVFTTTCTSLVEKRKLEGDCSVQSLELVCTEAGVLTEVLKPPSTRIMDCLFIRKIDPLSIFQQTTFPSDFFFQNLIPWWSALYLLAVNSCCPCIDLGARVISVREDVCQFPHTHHYWDRASDPLFLWASLGTCHGIHGKIIPSVPSPI